MAAAPDPRRAAPPAAPDPLSGLQARGAATVAVTGLALVLVAFIFDAAPLFVPGVALTTLGVLAPVWVWSSAHGARVRRILAAEHVTEDDPLTAEIEVRRGRLPLGGWGRLEIIDPLTDSRLALGSVGSPLRGSRAARIRVTARFCRRGEQRLAPPSLVARDPLELARAQTAGAGAVQTVLVLPRTEAVRWQGGRQAGRLEAGDGDIASEAMAATDLEGLRPYRPGTPASRIHWPAVARGRGLIERRLQADGDNRPLLVLDIRERLGRDHDPGALDAAVRATASLALDLARGGGCGLLLPGQTRPTIIGPELSAWPVAYARLAVVGTAADPRAPRAPLLAGSLGRSGPLIYVAAVSHERVAAGLTSTGRRRVLLVVPDGEVIDGRPRGLGARARLALAVSGCQGFALGAARQSPRVTAAGGASRA